MVVVPRETPVTRSHLEHLIALHDAGAVVLPASPGFYAAGAQATAAAVDRLRRRQGARRPRRAAHPVHPLGGAGRRRVTSQAAGRTAAPTDASVSRSGRAGVVLVRQALSALEQGAYLGLPEPPVAAGCPDTADPACRRPSGHGLRVDAEQRGHLARRQQTISRVHVPLLAS